MNYLDVMQVADNQLIFINTVGPIENIFLVFSKQCGPMLFGRVIQINRYQPIIWCILICPKNNFRAIVRNILNYKNLNSKCQFNLI